MKITIREINLFRTLPACLALSLTVLACLPDDLHIGAGGGALLGCFITTLFCMLVRLGSLPWFAMKDGKKHKWVVWLEERVPFLRADFYRK
ncbi:MAG: hypothetical protein ABI273_21180 [Lacunisphaera sp.]